MSEHTPTQTEAWPATGTETLRWVYDPHDPRIPRQLLKRVKPTYEAALPPMIAEREVAIPAELGARLDGVMASLVRFDEAQRARGYHLPALLLRSESSCSSQIERLTSSVRDVALAELSPSAPANAKLIAGNVRAMRAALDAGLKESIGVDDILAVHRALMDSAGLDFAGQVRAEQVWIGGTNISPHGAVYVPPHHSHLPAYLDDLAAWAARDDLNPIVHAAVLHAQLESVHPFVDGNGRTGRALVHSLLRRDGVLANATLPVSAGLLHDVGSYMAALARYQQGDPVAVVRQLADALEVAVVVGRTLAAQIDEVLARWAEATTDRADAAIHRLPALLVEQPVVSIAYVAEGLGVSGRTATTAVARAVELGILSPMGSRRRGGYYEARELLDVLERASSAEGLRRLVPGHAG